MQDAKDTLKALGQLMTDVLGQSATVVTGLAAVQSSPATLAISLAAGGIYQLAAIDAIANGAIAQDTAQILQQGIIGAQSILLSTSGLSAGQSRWSLIEAQFSQSDSIRAGDPNGGLLFFYNSANVNQPFEGPGGSGTTSPTVRQGLVTVQVINGTAAATGAEVPPQPTPGWTPLYLVDLSFGQSQITTAQIHAAAPSAGTGVPNNYPYAPFLAGLTNSHHGGVPGQAPKINLATEVQGVLPLANMAAVRTVLFANLALFVNGTTGNDSNNGLTSSTAFKTIQAAVIALYKQYDLAGFTVTINVAAGTYTAPTVLSGLPVGSSPIVGAPVNIAGAGSGSTTISVASGNCFTANVGAGVTVRGLTLTATGSVAAITGFGLLAALGSSIVVGTDMVFGATVGAMYSTLGSQINIGQNYSVTAGGALHYIATAGGIISSAGAMVTLSGTPAFSVGFAEATECGVVNVTGMTFAGTGATGSRYAAFLNGIINTASGGNASYFPGSTAGTTTTGGQYT